MPAFDWNPSFSPVGMTIILFACGLLVTLLLRQVRANRGKRAGLLLFAPKIVLILLILIALLDPTLRFSNNSVTPTKINILLDISSSMDLRDDGISRRSERATRIIKKLEASVPAHFQFQVLPFDTSIHPVGYSPKDDSERGTDLPAVFTAPLDDPLLADANGELVITDGGDETVELPKLPGRALAIIGIGAPAESWCDIGIESITAPATVEENSQFEIQAPLYAREGTLATNRNALSKLKVTLEQFRNKRWAENQTQFVDLTSLHALADFRTQISGTGEQRFRIVLPELPGEITTANNVREISIEVQKRALHVLYFTQELGVDYKYLRNELGTDPGVVLTAMYRVLEDQFTVQGDRTGLQDLVSGFPTKLEILKRYDCVILGSFSAKQLSTAQQQTLVQFVQDGGALIFLGGDSSFGLGGYADSKLAPLFPFAIRKDEPPVALGTFPVSLAPSAASVSFTDGWAENLASSGGATLESLNRAGNLRPGGIALLNAAIDGQNEPVVALQHYGKGQVLAIASNTLWKWATASEVLHNFYSKFLRQTVRGLTQRQEGGSLLGVRWDREHYRPGETAELSVRLQDSSNAGQIKLTASLNAPHDKIPVSLEATPGQPGFYAAKVLFKERGDYTFHLEAYRGEQLVENYQREEKVEPLIAEGADPELKEAYLQDIAARTKGVYANEKDIAPVTAFLRRQIVAPVTSTTIRLVEFWDIFPALILLTLVTEWTLRRRNNLV